MANYFFNDNPELVLSTGRWWRFMSYESVNGAIQPRSDADLLEYDPWEDYSQEGHADAPYLSFTYLADLFESEDGIHTDIVRETIIDWCNRHGLLGLLPHRTRIA